MMVRVIEKNYYITIAFLTKEMFKDFKTLLKNAIQDTDHFLQHLTAPNIGNHVSCEGLFF